MSTPSLRRLAGALCIAAFAAAVPAAPPGPMQTVKNASDQILDILRNPQLPKTERWTHIAPVISENFDFMSMSQGILATQWKSATLEEQRQFVDFFSQYIEGTYRNKIEAYSGQRIEYKGEKIRGDRAAVNSVIHTETAQIPVGYYLRRGKDGVWRAYDVTIEGSSLVNSYRETYAAISKTSGISGVLAHVKRRAAELKARDAAASGAVKVQ